MNCKKQDELFSYREPETGMLRNRPIPKGGQIVINGKFTESDLMQIVDQHRAYGMVDVKDIDRTAPFINLCYQLNKPMTEQQIKYGFEHNTDVLVERGQEQRNIAAVAISGNLAQVAQDTGGAIKEMDLQLVDKTEGDTNTGMDELVRVDSNVSKKDSGKRSKGRIGRAA